MGNFRRGASDVSVTDDGSWLAVVSRSNPAGQNHDLSPELFLVSGDGATIVQLTDDPALDAGSVLTARISGSGNRILFSADKDPLGTNPARRAQLFIIDTDGSNLIQLTNATGFSELGAFDLSDDGSRIVFAHTGDLTGQNPDGTSEVFVALADGTGLSQYPNSPTLNLRGSPDGRSLLLSTFYDPTSAVWLHDLERGLTSRQRSSGTGYFAIWGPEPGEITYDRTSEDGHSGLFSKPVGASTADETEIEIPDGVEIWMADWSSDGKHLMGVDVTGLLTGGTFDLWAYSREEGWTQITSASDGQQAWPALSPDGRRLAYGSTELGDSFEVLVRPFPGKGPVVQVSRSGGSAPVWSRDGSELFYLGRDDEGVGWVMAVPMSTLGERFEVGNPVKLFKDIYGSARPIRSWDVLSDGRFVFAKDADDEDQRAQWHERLYPNRIHIIQNWASSLD